VQHFKFVPYFHKTTASYQKRRDDDGIKMKSAMADGYTVIRIDFKSYSEMKEHIDNGLVSQHSAYFSNLDMYEYITTHL
jgi:hypothetical protein